MRARPSITTAAATLLAAAFVAATAVVAQDDIDSAAQHPLVGTWVLDALPDIEGNPPALTTFHAGGTLRELGGNASIGGGAWVATSARAADITIVTQSRTADGAFEGLQTIRASLEVAEDGQTLSGRWTLEPPAALSERMGLEPGQLGPGDVTGALVTVEPMGEVVADIPAGPPPD